MKTLCLLLCLLQLSPFTAISAAPPTTGAAAFALLETENGELLLGANENARLPMASTTKIMTALLVLRLCALDDLVTVPVEAAVEGSSMYLSPGERLTVEALLYGLLLQSANDAAVALAIHAAGSTERFAALMNAEAARLGLENTHFVTVNGLDDPAHYTTAAELGKLTAAALREPTFAKIVATSEKVVVNAEGKRYFLTNHNRLLREYPGCVGVKTGYTMRSGRCLVSAATRDGMTLIAVTLSDRQDWRDHRALLDYGFSGYRRLLLAEAGALTYGELSNSAPLTALVSIDTDPTITLTVRLTKTGGEAIFTVGKNTYTFPLTK